LATERRSQAEQGSEVDVKAIFGLLDCFSRFGGALALVVLLLATLLLADRGLNLAVEFTGGITIEARHPEVLTSESLQDTLARAGFTDASVKRIGGYSHFWIILPGREDVLMPQLAQRIAQQVIAALSTEHPGVEVARIEVITPKVGGELLSFGAIPLILACGAIMIRPAVRYGWRFALSIAVTNVRNTVIVLGLFLSAYTVFQWEFSLFSLLAMDCLAILVAVIGAIKASRVSAP
jgi:preprotein translocase subunit SecF